MKIALGAIALLLFAAISAQANEIPHCEVIPGGIRTPPQVFKDCVNGVYLELIFRDGYMIDCKGRKVCRLPEGIRMDVGIVGKDVKPSKADSPYDIGHACIIHKKDGQRTYLINKCSVDLNIKWNDRLCGPTRREKYPCSASMKPTDRIARWLIIRDGGIEYETMPDVGIITSVACMTPLYPYEESYGRVICR